MSPRAAVTTLFALNGFLFGSLYARMPALRDGLSLSNGQLGLALLAITLALVLTSIPAGALIARFGSRPVVIGGALVAMAGLPLAGAANTFAGFAAGLAIYGAGAALIDVAMNVKGLAIEQSGERRIFGSFHAGFSFGGLAGLSLGALAAAASLDPTAQFLITAALALLTIALIAPAIGARPGEASGRQGRMFVRPDRRMTIVGFVAFCVLLAEGSVSDWGAIFLHDNHNTSEALAAAGLAVFELTLGFGRLAADPLSERFGSQALIRVGGAAAAVVMTAVLIAPSAGTSIAALLVLGAVMAPMFPMTLRASGATGPAMAFATGCAYTGLMTGPPVIGGLAELFDLRLALLLVVACCVVGAVLAPRGADD
jgi:MFS family permease